MLNIDNDDEDPHEVIDETMFKMEEQHNLPFQTLSSSSMPASSPGFRSTLLPSGEAIAPAVVETPILAPGPTLSPSTPITVPIINLSDACNSGFRRR
jgi:hypothetical protein